MNWKKFGPWKTIEAKVESKGVYYQYPRARWEVLVHIDDSPCNASVHTLLMWKAINPGDIVRVRYKIILLTSQVGPALVRSFHPNGRDRWIPLF